MQLHLSRRIMMTLVNNIFDDIVDNSAAVAIIRDLIAAGRRNPSRNSPVPTRTELEVTSQPQGTFVKKIAHKVAMIRRDNEKRISKGVRQCWQENVDEYRQVARDYQLSQAHKLQFLRNILCGDTKLSYLDIVDVV